MTEQTPQFKRPKTTRKKEPVRKVALSDEAKQAYESLMKERDDREKQYGRHLGADNKIR